MSDRSERAATPRVELVVASLLLTTGALASGFVLVYAFQAIPHATQFLGLSLGLAFISLAVALLVIARRLVASEEAVEDYPPDEHPEDERQLESIVSRVELASPGGAWSAPQPESQGSARGRVRRSRHLARPGLRPRPVHADPVAPRPWARREDGRPLLLDDVEEADFYTAYPKGEEREQLGAPLIVVRLPVTALRLPPGRQGWAPEGVVAYSKICTHAGCAISLYRTPTFPETEPGPALVCPCHYSSFDPTTGGTVIFGPAGRPLPQLPLELGPGGELRAAGNFSGPSGRRGGAFAHGRPDDPSRYPLARSQTPARRRGFERRCATCSPTTGRSCLARSRSIRSSSSSRRASTSSSFSRTRRPSSAITAPTRHWTARR